MKRLISLIVMSFISFNAFAQEIECWAPKFFFDKNKREFILDKPVHVKAKHHNWTINEFDAFYAYRRGSYLRIEYAIGYLRTKDQNYVHIDDMQRLDLDFCTATEIEAKKYRQ